MYRVMVHKRSGQSISDHFVVIILCTVDVDLAVVLVNIILIRADIQSTSILSGTDKRSFNPCKSTRNALVRVLQV
jgi:hypothetical protein